MDAVINNVADLKLEIERLKQIKNEQELVIKQHFNSPRAILGTVASFFNRHKTGDEAGSLGSTGHDLIGYLSKLILPLTLNKTLFRKSGFIVKALVGILSQKASGLVNDKSVGTLWDKIRSVIPEGIIDKLSPKKPKSVFNLLRSKKTNQKTIKQ